MLPFAPCALNFIAGGATVIKKVPLLVNLHQISVESACYQGIRKEADTRPLCPFALHLRHHENLFWMNLNVPDCTRYP